MRKLTLLLTSCTLLLLPLHQLRAATNLVPLPQRTGFRTNLPPTLLSAPKTNLSPRPPAAARTNLPGTAVRSGSKTNVPPSASAAAQKRSAIVETLRRLQSSPTFYPVAAIVLCLLVLLVFRAFTPKSKTPDKVRPQLAGSKAARAPTRKAGISPVHACNVLDVGPEARQVWQFEARAGNYVLNREQTCLEGERLAPKLVGKDWRSLFQTKLNIAWLPP